jgi:hypothetical protein
MSMAQREFYEYGYTAAMKEKDRLELEIKQIQNEAAQLHVQTAKFEKPHKSSTA